MTRMTGGELWIVCDRLGLGRAELARILNVTPAAVEGWELSKTRTPHRVTEAIGDIKKATNAAVENLVAELRAMTDPQVTIHWAPDAVPPGRADVARYGFRWWRLVVDRAMEKVPETRVGSPEEIAEMRNESPDIERSGDRENRHEK